MKLVIKIGGSILFDKDEINIDLIQEWIEVIKELHVQEYKVGIVVGGGNPARTFSKAARELGGTNSYQDILGIEAAKQNARLFIAGLPMAYPEPPASYQDLLKLSATHDLIISGGFQPGQSTNAVAALFAETINADYLFNISDISKVHDKDPQDHDDAVPFDKLSYDEFSKILQANEQLPGTYELFDSIGINIVKRSQIKLVFLDGKQPSKLLDVLSGTPHGTVVQ